MNVVSIQKLHRKLKGITGPLYYWYYYYHLFLFLVYPQGLVKDTHKENAPYKTQALTESMNMDICVVGTLNRSFYIDIKFSKTPFFVISPFCTPHSNCLKISFEDGSK